LIDRTTDRGR